MLTRRDEEISLKRVLQNSCNFMEVRVSQHDFQITLGLDCPIVVADGDYLKALRKCALQLRRRLEREPELSHFEAATLEALDEHDRRFHPESERNRTMKIEEIQPLRKLVGEAELIASNIKEVDARLCNIVEGRRHSSAELGNVVYYLPHDAEFQTELRQAIQNLRDRYVAKLELLNLPVTVSFTLPEAKKAA